MRASELAPAHTYFAVRATPFTLVRSFRAGGLFEFSASVPLLYAIALEPAARRKGRAPGTGNVIFQKLVSAFTNSSPTLSLPSRSLFTYTTRVSTDRLVFSF